MAQTKQEIKGQFYLLQHCEWLRACKELKSAQKGVHSKDNIKQQVRDRLYTQLGGLVEIATPVGRIEVKAFKDWKTALGQVLAYSSFYPEDQKRIHLFESTAELGRIVDMQAACLRFDVLVTGEEVAA